MSYDRALINNSANRIVELAPETRRLSSFRGGYRDYLGEKERICQRQLREPQDDELQQLEGKLDQEQESLGLALTPVEACLQVPGLKLGAQAISQYLSALGLFDQTDLCSPAAALSTASQQPGGTRVGALRLGVAAPRAQRNRRNSIVFAPITPASFALGVRVRIAFARFLPVKNASELQAVQPYTPSAETLAGSSTAPLTATPLRPLATPQSFPIDGAQRVAWAVDNDRADVLECALLRLSNADTFELVVRALKRPGVGAAVVQCLLAHLTPDAFKALDQFGVLRLAVLHQQPLPIIEALLQAGFDPVRTHFGTSPLHVLAYYPPALQDTLVELLVHHGANVNAYSEGSQPLHLAILFSTNDGSALLSAMTALLRHGADPQGLNGIAHSPLRRLCSRATSTNAAACLQGIELLLAYGADINHTNRWGDTALAGSVVLGPLSLIEGLLELGADPRVRRDECANLLEYTACCSRSGDRLRLLKKYCQFTLRERLTALGRAAQRGFFSNVLALL